MQCVSLWYSLRHSRCYLHASNGDKAGIVFSGVGLSVYAIFAFLNKIITYNLKSRLLVIFKSNFTS